MSYDHGTWGRFGVNECHEQSSLLRLFIDASPFGIVWFGVSGDVLHINPEAIRLLRPTLPTSEFVNIFVMLGGGWPELTQQVRSITQQEVTGRSVRSVLLGGPESLSLSLDCVDQATFVLTVADVSATVAVERALRESEGRLRSVFDSIDEGYCVAEMIVDDAGTAVDYLFLEINSLFEELTGLSNAVNRTALELVPNLEPVWVETYARVGLGRESIRFEERSQVMGRSFDVYAMPVEPHGRFAIVFRNVTDRVRAEEAARDSSRFTGRVLGSLSLFVAVLSPDGTVVDTNLVNPRDAGPSRWAAAAVGRKLWETSWFSHSAVGQCRLQDSVAKAARGETIRYDTELIASTGQLMWVDIQVASLRDDLGIITHLILSAYDVTERVVVKERLAETIVRERDARGRVELLQRNATRLAAAPTVEAVARSVLDELRESLGLGLAALNIVESDGLRVIASQISDPAEIDRHQGISIDADLPGPSAIRLNKRIVVNSFNEMTARFPSLDVSQYIIESLVAIPIRSITGLVLGALVVASPSPNLADATLMQLLEAIAEQTGQAVDRAQLHDQVLKTGEAEHAIALKLQQALLPDHVVRHAAFPIAARYRAASDLLAVGGDWYDTFLWADRHVAIVVGDVVGHDVEAATMMGRLRIGVSALASGAEANPVAILDATAQCARHNRTTFATTACVVVDTATGVASYSLAGHLPPLLLRADGTTSWLDAALGPPITCSATPSYPERQIKLEPGTAIVMYSDGLIERRDESLAVGMDRLARFAGQHASLDTDQLADTLIAEFTTDSRIADDIIVVCARWEPPNDLIAKDRETIGR